MFPSCNHPEHDPGNVLETMQKYSACYTTCNSEHRRNPIIVTVSFASASIILNKKHSWNFDEILANIFGEISWAKTGLFSIVNSAAMYKALLTVFCWSMWRICLTKVNMSEICMEMAKSVHPRLKSPEIPIEMNEEFMHEFLQSNNKCDHTLSALFLRIMTNSTVITILRADLHPIGNLSMQKWNQTPTNCWICLDSIRFTEQKLLFVRK